ncbi:hypothetical protein NQ318_007608 [Aromia moschata]|uniref:Reverse transcriptase N-terminal domain-containing protein n=1 Tax=Aromia moschata TaxID=1265417 RepID=A0AAV8YAH9_9CUCU|nr:hypothetical protein NQ318_007608 [Aromia moschata]
MKKELLKNPENRNLEQEYKRYRNRVTSLIKTAKANFYKRQIDNYSGTGDSKHIWNVINQATNDLKIKTNSEEFVIQQKETVTYLGVVVDKHIRWDSHIEYLKKKLRYVLSKIKHIKTFLQPKQLKIIYHALVESHLTYGIIAWGAANKTCLNDIAISNNCSITKWQYKIYAGKSTPDYNFSINMALVPKKRL